MALIKCKECGKEISDKAVACPHCGCPVQMENDAKTEVQNKPTVEDENQQQNISTGEKKKKGHGCLTSIIIFFLLVGVIGVAIMQLSDDQDQNLGKNKTGIVTNYIDVTDEQGSTIDDVLAECGIENVKNITHDELLDNAHVDGETGYRISVSDNIDNVILYLNADKTVYSVRYADYDLYADGSSAATLQDYTVTSEEASDWMIKCEDKIKELLKSPSTAKFPNILEWGFRKEKNIMTVQGYVDAQNGFGAETRSKFQFIIDTDTNTIQSLIFDGQEMIAQ